MRATVLADPAFVEQAGRFVWLDVDTEKPGNAPFLEKYPVDVWPTFLVIDPRTEKAALRWPGSATAAQLGKLLADGERAVRGAAGDGPEALLARADRLNAEGKAAEAAKGYREAIARGGPGWERRPRAVESLVLAQLGAGELEDCAAAARAEAPGLARGPSFGNVVGVGLSCALSAPGDAPWRAGAVKELEPLAREALGLPGLLADDRSGLYEGLVDLREERGDASGARELAEEWWAFLDGEGKRARTAEARAALDSRRVACALKLGDPARAVPALRASERALPRDYNPPARLSVLYAEMGKVDDALAASGRAIARAYGPRKVRLLDQRAALYDMKGDRARARRALQEALDYGATLPVAQRPEGLLERLEARLGETP